MKNEDGRSSINNNINEHKRFPKKTNRRCRCSTCEILHSTYQILSEEIRSTQKSIAHCKEDTNKILGKIAKLETFFQ